MTGADLLAEYAAYAAAATPAHDQALIARGVPADWLRAPAAPARYGFSRARHNDDGTWEPADDGLRCVILPDPPLSELDSPDWPTVGLADLIAFPPDRPGEWRIRCGSAILNAEEVERCAFHGEPLVIHPTPMDWLRAEGQGVVILDWSAFLPFHLSGPPAFRCATRDLAARLDRALHRPAHRHRIEAPPREAAA